MQVVLVSDTHVKSRAPELPGWVRKALRAADHVVHAGDFDSKGIYEELRDIASSFTAVGGNMDRALELPQVAMVDLDGVQFVVTHGTGPDEGYRQRVAGVVDEHAGADGPTVGVSGHTHQILDVRVDGYRLLNPGSATGAWPAQEATLMVATVDGTERRARDLDVEIRRG